MEEDFNSLELNLPTYHQAVTCTTRANKVLDKLYTNISNSYVSNQFPPVGLSDHNLVYLLPKYVQKVRRIKPVTATRLVWSPEACDALLGELECTDWSVFYNECINAFVESVTGYINFCVQNTIPTKTFRLFSNNKPWLCREVTMEDC